MSDFDRSFRFLPSISSCPESFMQNPIDVGTKTIDAATVHCVRPLSADRLVTLNMEKNFALEIRTINGGGAFIEAGMPIADIIAGFARIGEELTLLGSGEAIRKQWVASVKDFVSRPDQPAKYNSVVKFVHPGTGRSTEEWFAAKRTDIVGTTPRLEDLAGGPKSGPF
jgi:hypothetical protein